MQAVSNLSGILYPREGEMRRLETLILEGRQTLQDLARRGHDDEQRRRDVAEMAKMLARMKAIDRYHR